MKNSQRFYFFRGLLIRVALLTSIASIMQSTFADSATLKQQANNLRGTLPDAKITILYDAFGRDASLKKDWGFSALIEVNGKRILFDTGNNSEIFAHNVQTKGVDLANLDFVVMSHRHGDHIGGLNYLLSINPDVKIYAPKENFGVFGSSFPGTFYRGNEVLPPDMRYFDGKPPETLNFGTPWPEARFTWVAKTTEVIPGFHLVVLKGSWGVDLDVMEISLAIDTPDGIVLIVGCAHPTIEKIVKVTEAEINKPIHLIVGGLHLLPADDVEIQRIATALHDTWKVKWLAPDHCTGEPAFEILKKAFADHYLYAGLGATLSLGRNRVVSSVEQGSYLFANETDRQIYLELSRSSADALDNELAHMEYQSSSGVAQMDTN